MNRLSPLIAILLVLVTAGCVHRATGRATAPAPSILRVGITPDARPMAFRENGEIRGLEADLARGLARAMGKQVRFVELAWPDEIPALTSGRIDIIMSAMSVTRDRSMLVDFTDPYMVTGQIALVRLGEYNRYSNGFTDLLRPNIRIGTVRGTTGDAFIVRHIARARPVRFRDVEQGVRALAEKKIDVFVYDLPMNLYYGALYAGRGLTPVLVPMTREKLAWGVRHGDKELREKANSYLAGIRKSGELEKMIEHWVPFYKNLHDAR